MSRAATSKLAWAAHRKYGVLMLQDDRKSATDLVTVLALLPSCDSARGKWVTKCRRQFLDAALRRLAVRVGTAEKTWWRKGGTGYPPRSSVFSLSQQRVGKASKRRQRVGRWAMRESRRWRSAHWCVFKTNRFMDWYTRGDNGRKTQTRHTTRTNN